MKKTQKNKNIDKLFIVCWKDHTANANWIDDIKKEKFTVCWSVGWLKDEDENVIKLVDTYTDEKQVGGVMVILKSCIDEMYRIDIQD